MSRSPNPRSPNITTAAKGAQTVFNRGAAAAKAGLAVTACPYSLGNTGSNQPNPSARWRTCWMKGYRSVRPLEPVTSMTDPKVEAGGGIEPPTTGA